MEAVLISGLTVGALVVLLCGAEITEPLRRLPYLGRLLDCTFCTSFWVAAAVDPSPSIMATIAVANIVVYHIELSLGSYYASPTETYLPGTGPERNDQGE